MSYYPPVRHNEIRDELAVHARALGFDAETEVDAPDGRADLVIHKPLIVVEVKVNAKRYPGGLPRDWRSQLDRYTRSFGTRAQRWLVFETAPRWWIRPTTGWEITDVVDFKARLERLALDGTPLRYTWKHVRASA